jgi:adenylate cyclase
MKAKGLFIPISGGDPIPLLKDEIVIGRRPDCDIQLGFANVSGKHCELRLSKGLWVVKDLGSTNGVSVNGEKVDKLEKRRLIPGDKITIARKHHFKIEYDYDGPLPRESREQRGGEDEVFGQSLLERAGLAKAPKRLEPDSDLYDEDSETGRKRWKLSE